MKYPNNKSIVEIEKEISTPISNIVLNGKKLSVQEILSVARSDYKISFTKEKKVYEWMKKSYEAMISDVKHGVPVYGTNTGYGARAKHILTDGTVEQRMDWGRKLSEGIAHVDITTGPELPLDVTKAGILIRINMLMGGVSGIKLQDLEIYRALLNAQIIPIVNQYGGVGASGDLHHNGRVLSAARQLPGVRVKLKNGEIKDAATALREAGISPLKLDPKAGLAFVNGDNFSTAAATVLAVDTLRALLIAQVTEAMLIEVLKGTNRSFHPVLSFIRPHSGQDEAASLFRYLLQGSKLIYDEMKGPRLRPPGIKVQDGYSLRCLAQYNGVNFEKIKSILEIITINANSVSDNPVWVPPEQTTKGEKPWQWVSGGNFIAMHMVEAIDALRKIMTQIVKVNDRHLARLIDTNENNGLPPNLSDKKAVTQSSFKGVQVHSGMLEVYSSLLSIPVSTFFGTHEEGNQDITSHALTSAIIGFENLRLTRYSIAQNLISIAQAVDLRGGRKNLSPRTRPVYDFVRNKVKYVETERPLANDMEALYDSIIDGSLMDLIRTKVTNEYGK